MSTPAPIRQEPSLHSQQWRRFLHDGAIEVFSLMLGSELKEPAEPSPPVVSDVTAMVGLAGTLEGMLSFRCSANVATQITARMLGLEQKEAEEQRCDAVGEACNMVAGAFKSKHEEPQKSMILSVPTVIFGGDYAVHSLTAGEHITVPLMFENEVIWFGVEIRD